jgi:hypothetical protein
MMPCKRTTELTLQSHLQACLDLSGLEIFAGHRAATRTLPCVIVYGDKEQEHPDFPPGTGVMEIKVKVFILTQADDEKIEVHDQRVRLVQAWLEPLALSPRTLDGLYFYTLLPEQADEGRDDRHFGEVLHYTAIVQLLTAA